MNLLRSHQDSTPASLNFGVASSAGQNPASSGQTSASAGQTSASAGQTSASAGQTSASAGQTSASAGQIPASAGRDLTPAGPESTPAESAGVGRSFVELRDKIEQQLYRRKDVAKPAGGVDVGAGREGAGVGGGGGSVDETNEDVKGTFVGLSAVRLWVTCGYPMI